MLRRARTPKVHDWLVNYVMKKSSHAEPLRLAWITDPDPVVASAGWALTTERVARKPDGLDLPGLLDIIEAEMRDAPAAMRGPRRRTRWGAAPRPSACAASPGEVRLGSTHRWSSVRLHVVSF